jgi:hypothetical protein
MGVSDATGVFGNEEYERYVPNQYRRKFGLPPDEMAAELGYSIDSELYAEIDREEMCRRRISKQLPKGARRFRVKDFFAEAGGILRDAYVSNRNPFELIDYGCFCG